MNIDKIFFLVSYSHEFLGQMHTNKKLERGWNSQFSVRWVHYSGYSKSTGRKTGKSCLCALVKIGHRMMMMHQNFQLKTYNSVSATYCWRAFAEIPIFFLSSMEPKPIWSCSRKTYFCGYKSSSSGWGQFLQNFKSLIENP